MPATNVTLLLYDRTDWLFTLLTLHPLWCVCVCVFIQIVSSLFLKHSESASQQRSNVRRSSTARRYQANTVSAKFQSSLQELLEKMERFDWNCTCLTLITRWRPLSHLCQISRKRSKFSCVAIIIALPHYHPLNVFLSPVKADIYISLQWQWTRQCWLKMMMSHTDSIVTHHKWVGVWRT